MRVGLFKFEGFNVHLVDWINKSGTVQVEIVTDPLSGQFLCPIERFESIERGRNELRKLVIAHFALADRLCVACVRFKDAELFVSMIDYAALQERELANQAHDIANLQAEVERLKRAVGMAYKP